MPQLPCNSAGKLLRLGLSSRLQIAPVSEETPEVSGLTLFINHVGSLTYMCTQVLWAPIACEHLFTIYILVHIHLPPLVKVEVRMNTCTINICKYNNHSINAVVYRKLRLLRLTIRAILSRNELHSYKGLCTIFCMIICRQCPFELSDHGSELQDQCKMCALYIFPIPTHHQ